MSNRKRRKSILEIAQGLHAVGAIDEARLKEYEAAANPRADANDESNECRTGGDATEPTDRPCNTCGTGIVRPTSLLGRRFEYRGSTVLFDADVVVPVCAACGELWLGSERTRRVNEVLERLRDAALRSECPAD